MHIKVLKKIYEQNLQEIVNFVVHNDPDVIDIQCGLIDIEDDDSKTYSVVIIYK